MLLGIMPGDAVAQRNELPIAIITASELTAEQVAEITRFVEANAKRMESADVAEVRTGRVALLEPVDNRDPAAAVGFRLKYGEIAAPQLRRIASGPDEVQAINALIVAGAIATLNTAAVLQEGFEDPRVAVRFGAFAASRRVFRAIELFSPAISDRDAIDFATRITQRMEAEADPQCFDAAVKALLSATEVRRQRFERVRLSAWKSLAEALSRKLNKLACDPAGDAFLPAVKRGSEAISAAAVQMAADLRADIGNAKAVLEVGAHIWAHVSCSIEDGHASAISLEDPPEVADRKREQRAALGALVDTGSTLMGLGVGAITDAMVYQAKDAGNWVREANAEKDRVFTKRVHDLLGPGGVITKPPLNYPGDAFIKPRK